MDALQIVFLIGTLITLGGALMVVTDRNLFRSATWLVVALFGVAVLFVLLEAGFLAAAQIVVYIGAIAILIIFAVMLTRRVMQPSPEAVSVEWPMAAFGALLLFGLLAVPLSSLGLIYRMPDWNNLTGAPAADTSGSLVALGRALVDATAPGGGYAVPFELASLLLVGALIGAIVIAREPTRAEKAAEQADKAKS